MLLTREIPNELIRCGSFCYWKYENRNGKRTKVPYNPLTGEMAKSNDKSTFCSFEQLRNDERYDGVGIGMFDGICAIDLDDCIDENGELSNLAMDVISIMNGYTEGSPSGKGIHIFFRVDGFVYDTGKYYIMNHKLGMEIYVAGATSKYVTIIGGALYNHREFGDRTAELQQVLDKYMIRKISEPPVEIHGINGANGINQLHGDESALTDSDIISRMSQKELWKGDWSHYPSHSEADMALCSHLAFWTDKSPEQMDRIFRKSGLMRKKWDRVQSGSTYGAITISRAIAMCRDVYHKPEQSEEQKPKEVSPEEKPAGAEFPALIPLEQQNIRLPVFPVEALPQKISDYVKAVAMSTQTAADMAATISIGVMAACLQGKYIIQPKPGYREPLNMYTMIIASPGERKSSVLSEMCAPLYAYEKKMNERMANEIRERDNRREELALKADGIAMKLKRKDDDELAKKLSGIRDELRNLPPLIPPRYFADDCTSESLTSLMAANGGCLSVISTEGGIFDILTGRYSEKVNIDTWLKGHSGDTIRVDRLVRSTEFIAHPALTAILTVQPSVLSNIMENSTLDGRGLLARFMYCSPPSRIGCRSFITPAVDETVKDEYNKLVHKLMSIPRNSEPTVLTLSDNALAEMDRYFLKHEKYLAGEGQDMIEWASKYIGAVLRIAGLIHVADSNSDDIVKLDTLNRAVEIGEYFLEQSRYAFSLMGVDETIRKAKTVVNKLKREKPETIKRCELFRLCRSKYFKKLEDIVPTLELLENNGYIRQVMPEPTTARGRKPDVLIRVNPLIHTMV